MEYRVLPHGGDKTSVIGLGSAGLHSARMPRSNGRSTRPWDAGVNHFDFIPSEAKPLAAHGRALHRHRADVHIQVHIGALYGAAPTRGRRTPSRYRRVRAAPGCDRYRLCGLRLHPLHRRGCRPGPRDERRHLGLRAGAQSGRNDPPSGVFHAQSPHRTAAARNRCVRSGHVQPETPMYDYTDESEYGQGEVADRMALLREFERAGVGRERDEAVCRRPVARRRAVSVGRALTRTQCIQYALDKPGVVTVLPGVHGTADLHDLLAYFDATPEERDYSVLATCVPQSREARCVYCNHCQPCPAGLQIGLINKYYDLARVGDAAGGGALPQSRSPCGRVRGLRSLRPPLPVRR